MSKYVQRDMYETINRIDAVLYSTHLSGKEDSFGREKPYPNISIGVRNIWVRATDIDRKNIRIKATKSSDYLLAFVATMKGQDWMRRSGYGTYLNDWGRTLATYCSAVSKFVEKDGQLTCTVVPWNRLIPDPIDFENNPKIEILEFTPAQLKRQGYDPDMVEALIEAAGAAREHLDGTKKDTKAEYIKCYEVHGELPLSLITDNERDDETYVQQMHVVSFVAKKKGGKTEYEDFTLYRGREKKDPYEIDHLIKEDGSTLGIGSIEIMFDPQWMNNHAFKLMKDQLDLASQLIFQTADGSFVGRNVLTQVMSGDILVHEADKPLTQLNNQSHDITALQNFALQWQALSKESTSTPDAIRGGNQPSGTAWRQVEALRVESHSLFEYMTENKGLAIEKHWRKHVIPFLKKQMDTAEEITAVLDSHGIAQFDAMYVPNEAIRRRNRKIIDKVLAGEIAEDLDPAVMEGEVRKEVATLGNQRFIKPSDIPDKTWKEVLKDFEWEVEVEVTNEPTEKEAVLTTLNTVLQTIARNPMILNDPAARSVFVKILEQTGAVSAIEIPPIQPQPQMMQQPTGGSSAANQQVTPIGVQA